MKTFSVLCWLACALGAFIVYPEGVPVWLYGLAAVNCAILSGKD